MGNIRPSFIKTRAKILLEEYPDRFNDDFEHNKALVTEFTDVTNKRMRNWIAGYVTRLVANQYRREGKKNTSQASTSGRSRISLLDLIEGLHRACNQWHPRGNRRGSGAAGDVLEEFLGVPTNNLSLPDYGDYELKTHKGDTTALIKLFALAPNPRPFSPEPFLDVVGWNDEDHPDTRRRFSYTRGVSGNGRGFRISRDGNTLNFLHDSARVNRDTNTRDYEDESTYGAYADRVRSHPNFSSQLPKTWDIRDSHPNCLCCGPNCSNCRNIESRIRGKLQNTVLVEYSISRSRGQQGFRYHNAWLLSELVIENFIQSIDQDVTNVDFNMRTGHDHGVSFRIARSRLEDLFNNSRELIRNSEIVEQ